MLDDSSLYEMDIYNSSKFSYYGYANQALVSIHNNLIKDGHRILMLKASYANCMYPFLAACVGDIDVIDLRKFDGSIIDYISATNPDTILIVYDLSQYGKEEIKNSCFDFR